MEELRKELESFLRHVKEQHTDMYGHLQVIDTPNENIRKDYPTETIEGVVDNYLTNFKK